MTLKNIFFTLILSLLLTACTKTSVIPKTKPVEIKVKVKVPDALTQLPEEVAKLLRNQGVSEKGMSAYVHALSSPKPLLTFNADVPRNPASVMKLITTYSALGILGADYRWPIELYYTGTVSGGVLHGDLFLKGYGYPDFKPHDLRLLLKGLHKRGIRQITGNLILDNTYFKNEATNPAAFDGKPYARYNALPDALLYNERISEFVVKPNNNAVSIVSTHPAKNVTIVNNLKLKNIKCSGRYANPRMKILSKAKEIKVQFDGFLSNRCGERKYSTVISNPVNMLYGSIKKIWQQEMGGAIGGNRLIVAGTPNHANLLYRLESKPVKDILPLINKKSNNVMARQLFLSIAAKAGIPATTQKGYQAIQQWFTSRGLNFPELRIENGSGLSRVGKVSARHIGELLMDAYKSPYRQDLLNSLPIMGVDGTLRKRMRNTVVANRGRFKTGTLRDARGIAGYVKAENGEVYVVAILHNDRTAKRRVLAAHNKLIEWTVRQPSKM
ncbi:MAG: D-alanyl-D-alanine carboxypeptidase/D-alanyl-D-alanine-endopeptidase [Methylococcaceae bacterium]|nr:D-alanyl-D-alanine carboxypeptidase/D-alanyl-D-alanine-endopeptidase [Methylococcaceae bacterium]